MAEKKRTNRRNALGRGLSALLNDSTIDVLENRSLRERNVSAGIGSIAEIALDQIEANPFQPRTDFDKKALEELADSIRIQGIIQPVTLRKLNKNTFQLISGERRLQASKLAGLTKLPAYIRSADDQQMLEMALIENIQRQDLNAIEIALSYQRLLSECALKQEELGARVGKNRTTVNNYLRLLKLPPDIQAAVRDAKISMGHARALINIDDPSLQIDLLKRILKEDMSVRKVEALVKQASYPDDSGDQAKSPVGLNLEMSQLQDKLSSYFGTKIKITSKDNATGEIKIPFATVTELNRLLAIIDA